MNHPEKYSPGKIPSTRRPRIIFVIIMLITTLAIIWPGPAIFSSSTPLILGFPLSFTWIILWVIIGFAALVGIYLSDKHEDKV
jgi:hypothetical protein